MFLVQYPRLFWYNVGNSLLICVKYSQRDEMEMKIVTNSPQEGGIQLESGSQRDKFFDCLAPEVLEAVCRGLDAQMHPMALVSAQLMVVRQTETCKNLLEDAAFYSIEGVLPQAVCAIVRQCIRSGEEQSACAAMMGQRWDIRILPAHPGALLVFSPETSRQAGISMAAAGLRASAAHLLIQADALEQGGQIEQACGIRREAMRILRQANHTQMLCGAPELPETAACNAGQLLERAREQLLARGVRAELCMRGFSDDANALLLVADEEKLMSALMALVSNSLRHGGADVTVTLSVEQQDDSVVLGVDDDGPGLSAEALARMNDTWRRPDAAPGSWGLGIPYVRRIVQLHGGVLLFGSGQEGGCAARIRLPRATSVDDIFESGSSYRMGELSAAQAADVELSDALDAAVYRRD